MRHPRCKHHHTVTTGKNSSSTSTRACDLDNCHWVSCTKPGSTRKRDSFERVNVILEQIWQDCRVQNQSVSLSLWLTETAQKMLSLSNQNTLIVARLGVTLYILTYIYIYMYWKHLMVMDVIFICFWNDLVEQVAATMEETPIYSEVPSTTKSLSLFWICKKRLFSGTRKPYTRRSSHRVTWFFWRSALHAVKPRRDFKLRDLTFARSEDRAPWLATLVRQQFA